jgi:hypothetical protein
MMQKLLNFEYFHQQKFTKKKKKKKILKKFGVQSWYPKKAFSEYGWMEVISSFSQLCCKSD